MSLRTSALVTRVNELRGEPVVDLSGTGIVLGERVLIENGLHECIYFGMKQCEKCVME